MPRISKTFLFTTGIDSLGNTTSREVDSNGNKIKSTSITYPPQTSGLVTYYSEPLEGSGYYNGLGLHTVTYSPWWKEGVNNVIVINNFRGNVTIQASLATTPTDSDWFDVSSTYTEFTDNSYGNVLHNFRGNYVWIRAKVVISAGVLREIALNH
jgi:hypothetical protein